MIECLSSGWGMVEVWWGGILSLLMPLIDTRYGES